jgi:hypothetical protein
VEYPDVAQPPIGIAVEATGESAGLVNRAAIAGGGATASASTENAIPVGERNQPAPGITSADAWLSNANGTLDDLAGSHPYAMTTVINLASRTRPTGEREGELPGGAARNLDVRLPAGLVGDLKQMPACKYTELQGASFGESSECPPASEVGTLTAVSVETGVTASPIFNMVPAKGEAAELGFKYANVAVLLHFTVRSGGDYGLTVHTRDLAEVPVAQIVTEIWGVPNDPSHDAWRDGYGCTAEQIEESPPTETIDYCTRIQGLARTPILTVPTSCGAPQQIAFRELGAWLAPEATSEAVVEMHNSEDLPAGELGCEDLSFDPATTLIPETSRADEATGLTAEVNPSLGGLETANSSGSSDIKDSTVTLPPGFTINPEQASGLQACSLSAAALEPLAGGEENDEAPNCPPSSRLGSILIRTPLLEGADEEKQLEGSIYLLPSNPPEIKLLAAASADGVNIKLKATAKLNEQTGQVTTVFTEAPQMPSSLFKLSFNGGAHAALTTPVRCGTYVANTDFTSWSSPYLPDFTESVQMGVVEGAEGGACPGGALPFSPQLVAGSTVAHAGSYTDVTMHVRANGGQQRLERFKVTMPEGAAASLASVPLCAEAHANAGTCPSASQIGHAIVQSGPGSSPLVLRQPGEPEIPIYLTERYGGAPFGVSIVTPVIAGPFNLGTIVTRGKIEIDPRTAQVTVETEPLPQIVKGVPTDLRTIEAVIDRPSFMFNPTNCTPLGYTGTAYGTPPPGESEAGETAALSSRFQVTGCRELSFEPKLSASTSAHTSKLDGASLHVKLTYPSGGVGSQAWLRSTKVVLPQALPSRLSTLQHSCTEKQYSANPAGCPSESIVGHAVVHTQLLPVPLEGPAYFVSNGSEAFPNLVIALQGDGVHIELVGDTDIKNGITSTTFPAVPDVPFETFELELPEGKFSALTAYGSVCQQALAMPTTFTGQNGAKLEQDNYIEVQGCPNTLALVAKKLVRKTLTLKVAVPAAGKLTVGGSGISSASKSSKGRETLTVKLGVALTRGQRALLGRHPGRKLLVNVTLRFTPAKGRRMAKTVKAVI